MRRIVCWMLHVSYLYSQLLGVLPITYNRKTGRVHTKRSLTLYSIAANIYTFASVPLLMYQTNLMDNMLMQTQLIHQIINMVMGIVRLVVVLISLLLNWWQRDEFMAVVRELRRLRERHFKQLPRSATVQRHFERAIMQKFSWGVLADFTAFALTLEAMRAVMSWRLFCGIASMSLLTNILNVIMNHYFFALQHINLHCRILNEELARILCEARAANRDRGGGGGGHGAGVYITKCCTLADQLDAVALAHRLLHSLAGRINVIFEIQGACVILNSYMTNIGTFYMCYILMQPGRHAMVMSALGWSLMSISIVAYYNDLMVFVNGMVELLEVFDASAALLRTELALPLLDVRLEQSLENFCRQIALNPLEMDLLGLYKFSKKMAFAIISSTVTHTILIVQYDYKINY